MQNKKETKKDKNNSSNLTIIAGVVLIILVAVAIILVVVSNNKNKKEEVKSELKDNTTQVEQKTAPVNLEQIKIVPGDNKPPVESSGTNEATKTQTVDMNKTPADAGDDYELVQPSKNSSNPEG